MNPNQNPGQEEKGMYDYETPEGYGDTFFIYVFDVAGSGIVNGKDYSLLAVPIFDGDFVLRAWNGLASVVNSVTPINRSGTIQLYDTLQRSFYSLPTYLPIRSRGQAVVPEVLYADGGFIRFDLTSVQLAVTPGGA